MNNNLGTKMDAQNMSGGEFFGSLPTEMMIKIIGLVGKIKNCHLVCKQFRRVCCAIEATKPNGVVMVLDDKKVSPKHS